jgi:hypothetical protein
VAPNMKRACVRANSHCAPYRLHKAEALLRGWADRWRQQRHQNKARLVTTASGTAAAVVPVRLLSDIVAEQELGLSSKSQAELAGLLQAAGEREPTVPPHGVGP